MTVNCIYVRINILLEELCDAAEMLRNEISQLKDRMKMLGFYWEGEAYDEYSRVLSEDIGYMEITALNIVLMSRILYLSLSGYSDMEKHISEIVGGMKK